MKRARIVLFLSIFIWGGATAEVPESDVAFVLNGVVTKIDDGDSLSLRVKNGVTFRVRLSDIDSPEIAHKAGQNFKCRCDPLKERIGQLFGTEARNALKALAPLGASIHAKCYELDIYGRSVCHAFVNGVNLNLEMLKRGWAMVFRKSAWVRDQESYSAEKTAKEAGLGVWQQDKPVYPGDWRKRCWNYNQC